MSKQILTSVIAVFLPCVTCLRADKYTFKLESFRIGRTRSTLEDTVHVGLGVKVGTAGLQHATRHLGNKKDGTHSVNLMLGPYTIDPFMPVVFNYEFINRGHGGASDEEIDRFLRSGADQLVSVFLGTGDIWAAVATKAIQPVGDLMNRNCDGPVAVDQFEATGDILNAWTRNGPHTETRFYPGVGAATVCESSKYWITWSIARVESGPVKALTDGPFSQLVAKHSGKCLDVVGVSSDNDAEINQWDCSGGDNQTWKIEDAGHGFSFLKAKHSGKCLDVSEISLSDGAAVIQWDCWGGDNQKWKIEPAGDGFSTLKAKHSGKCLDVSGVNKGNGARLQQWECWGGENQKWKLVRK
jgi:hypothetical protein